MKVFLEQLEAQAAQPPPESPSAVEQNLRASLAEAEKRAGSLAEELRQLYSALGVSPGDPTVGINTIRRGITSAIELLTGEELDLGPDFSVIDLTLRLTAAQNSVWALQEELAGKLGVKATEFSVAWLFRKILEIEPTASHEPADLGSAFEAPEVPDLRIAVPPPDAPQKGRPLRPPLSDASTAPSPPTAPRVNRIQVYPIGDNGRISVDREVGIQVGFFSLRDDQPLTDWTVCRFEVKVVEGKDNIKVHQIGYGWRIKGLSAGTAKIRITVPGTDIAEEVGLRVVPSEPPPSWPGGPRREKNQGLFRNFKR